jgi:Periplasmic protein involved in polysaccharide export
MKKTGVIILVFIQLFFLCSCLTTKQTNLLQDATHTVPHYSSSEIMEEYKIKQGDELTVLINSLRQDQTDQLFYLFSPRNVMMDGESKLRSFSVSPEGTIYFPYLGDITVKDLTTLEVQELLTQKINEQISEDCLVQVYLGNRFFSVIGESNAGRYPIAKERMTIFQALAQCRDIHPYGDRSKIKIIRQTESGSIIKTFDIRSVDIVNSEFYYIQPNDVIYIQPLQRQFLGLSSFSTVFAVISTAASLGFAIYGLFKNN